MPRQVWDSIVIFLLTVGVAWGGKTYVDSRHNEIAGDIKSQNTHLKYMNERLKDVSDKIKTIENSYQKIDQIHDNIRRLIRRGP